MIFLLVFAYLSPSKLGLMLLFLKSQYSLSTPNFFMCSRANSVTQSLLHISVSPLTYHVFHSFMYIFRVMILLETNSSRLYAVAIWKANTWACVSTMCQTLNAALSMQRWHGLCFKDSLSLLMKAAQWSQSGVRADASAASCSILFPFHRLP